MSEKTLQSTTERTDRSKRQSNTECLPISLLIPTMNRPHSLDHTLEFYCSGTAIPGQIVIADQSRAADIIEKVRTIAESYQHRFSIDVSYIHMDESSSSIARNLAMDAAEHDILIFSDDDVEVDKDTLKRTFIQMGRKDVAMLGAWDECAPPPGTKLGYLFGTRSFLKRHQGYVTRSMLGRYPDTIKGEVSTECVMGYYCVIRKSLAERWNIRWDEQMRGYAYAEDLDFTFGYYRNAAREHLKCILREDISVRHLGSREYRIPSENQIYRYIINRAYLCYKHHMGIRGITAVRYSDFWYYMNSLIHHGESHTIHAAIRRRNEVDDQLRQGILKEEFYQS